MAKTLTLRHYYQLQLQALQRLFKRFTKFFKENIFPFTSSVANFQYILFVHERLKIQFSMLKASLLYNSLYTTIKSYVSNGLTKKYSSHLIYIIFQEFN